MSTERKSGVEKITSLSKKIDIGTALAGLIIGGAAGSALVLWSGVTYFAADAIEKRQKK